MYHSSDRLNASFSKDSNFLYDFSSDERVRKSEREKEEAGTKRARE